jgi:hypothetical protein
MGGRDVAPGGGQRLPSRERRGGLHRADEIAGHFEQTIGGEWNVKFVELDSESAFTGKDGRVVERGDFAITAGADDSSCYRGSYIATWAPQGNDDWQLQVFSWQDLETELENCK